jgi:hypothetical protein
MGTPGFGVYQALFRREWSREIAVSFHAMRFSLAGALVAARLDLIFGLMRHYLIQKTGG